MQEYGFSDADMIASACIDTLRALSETTPYLRMRFDEYPEPAQRLLRYIPFLRDAFLSGLYPRLTLRGISIHAASDVCTLVLNALFEIWGCMEQDSPAISVFIESFSVDADAPSRFQRVLLYGTDTVDAALHFLRPAIGWVGDGAGTSARTRNGVFKLYKWEPDTLHWYRIHMHRNCVRCDKPNCSDRETVEYDNREVNRSQWVFDSEGHELQHIPEPWMAELGLLTN